MSLSARTEVMTAYLEDFLKYLRYELNRSAYTVLSYSTDICQFAEFITDGETDKFSPADVTVTDVRAWVGRLAAEKMSPRTLRRKVQSIRAFYRFLVKRGVAVVNPASDVTLAKIDKPLPAFVRASEMEKIIDEDCDNSHDSLRDSLLTELFYSTGMRQAELLSLRPSDILWSNFEFKITGKRNKQRIVPFAPELGKKIKRYVEVRDAEYPEFAGSEILFVNNGRPLNKAALYRIINKKLSLVASKKKSPHVLRHSFATAMLADGADLNTVKEFLGHTSLAATQIYTHLSFSELKNNYQHAHPRAQKQEV